MRETAFMEAIKSICEQDSRYDMEAYFFIREALDYTIRMLEKPAQGPGRHVSGRELLEGIRQYTLEEFGPMSLKVLNSWGLTNTADVGNLVFNLVHAGELGKTDEDKLEDFAEGFDFYEAFAKPFLPSSALADEADDNPTSRSFRS